MTDTDKQTIQEQKYRVRLEQQIEDMLPSLDVFFIIKQLDYIVYSTYERIDMLSALLKIKRKHPDKAAKVQRLINHYATEHDTMVVLKPKKA